MAAQAYLDWCRENKFIPKFSQFAYHPNYYKLLQDFNTIDLTTGEYAPQGAVTMTFPSEQNAFGNVESLIQQGLQEDAALEEKMEQEIDGIAVLEKRAVLYGGEGSVKIFTSSSETGLCDFSPAEAASNLPVGVVEVVDPIALSVKICERNHQCGCCFCRCDEIPEAVSSSLIGPLVDPDCGNRLYVSLGIFSVIRLKRPAQLLVSGTDYCVPDKESVTAEQDDPCSLFRTMAFPTGEFAGTNCSQNSNGNGRAVLTTANGVGASNGRCGCGN
jgi:hypothetical protein